MRQFRVTLFYREPSFELHAAPAPGLFRGDFEVSCSDPQEAVEHARARFHSWAKASSVGWVRRIEHVEVEELGDS